MPVFYALLLVFFAGLVGGIVNALMSDNGFLMPKYDRAASVYRPGCLGNALIGGVAAVVSWGLYGAAGSLTIFTLNEDPSAASTAAKQAIPILNVAGLASALLVGIGGARWLSNEVDKKLLRAAAVEAAKGNPSDSMAAAIAIAPPAGALRAAAPGRDEE